MRKHLLLTLVGLFAICLITKAETYSGTCGDNLTYSLDIESGELTISGTGEMKNYSSGSYPPWYGQKLLLKKIVIEDGITRIGNNVFKDCSNMTSVTIPNSVADIGSGAFEGCSSLSLVTIPNCVKDIKSNTFYGCSSLTSVTIPNSVQSIGPRAFDGCSSLASVNIPNSVTNIRETAFSNCPGLTSIVVEEGNTIYDSRNNCNAIINTAYQTLIAGCNSTIIPDNVTSIDSNAFEGCNLTSITIPNTITNIGRSAFTNCTKLTSVTIPNSVTSIESSTFYGCI